MSEVLNDGFLRITNEGSYIRIWYKTYLNDKLIEEKMFLWDLPRNNFQFALKAMAKQRLKRRNNNGQ